MQATRQQKIVRTGVIGILTNLTLVAFKAFVGIFTGSIAIAMDAINNLSDALSSLITIIGTKLAAKKPDKEHPLGHGRIEYITATIIAFIVLMAGIVALEASIKNIISGNVAHYDTVSFIIMGVAVVVKILLGRYTKAAGEKLQSQSLVASGNDALFDAIVTSATILSALLMVFFSINIDGWLGALIGLIIIKAGYDMIGEALNEILGNRLSASQSHAIKETIMSHPEIRGAYDLLVNNYGPEFFVGSVHIEVDEDMTARQIHTLTHHIHEDIMREYNIYLTFGIYALNTDSEAGKVCKHITEELTQDPNVLQIHAFYIDFEAHTISFDVVMSFEVKNREKFSKELVDKVKSLYPDYTTTINIDSDISD